MICSLSFFDTPPLCLIIYHMKEIRIKPEESCSIFVCCGGRATYHGPLEDGVDTVKWAASLPYSDGQVGMYGISYFGFTQWAAAVHQPPALKAMIPFQTWNDPFNGVIFRGGALELGSAASWNLMMGLDVLLRRHRGDPKALG